jgi:2,4-dienoyl-CoA reductase-like NADH-dependent reductase (Old Yellow Enzyme family)
MRFTLSVVDAIRKAVVEVPIEFRMSGDEICGGRLRHQVRRRNCEAVDGKVDLIHVSTGNHEVRHLLLDPSEYVFGRRLQREICAESKNM